MKRFAAVIILIGLGWVGHSLAQKSETTGTGDPTGHCNNAEYLNRTTGERWVCVNNAWSKDATLSFSLPSSTVGNLPTCNAGAAYQMRAVSDALLPAALATVAGGGAIKVAVMCDGTLWKIL